MQMYRHVSANQIILNEMPFERELSMEAYLIENEKILSLDNDDLSPVTVLDVELHLAGGRSQRGGDGRIDLVAQYGASTLGIIELKKGELTNAHLEQLEDYLTNTEQIKVQFLDTYENEEVSFIGVLVGNSIKADLREKIESGYLFNETIPIAALTLRRYRGGDGNIYVITDTYFRNASLTFDRTKYRFNGALYGKGRLVLAILKQYVEDNPGIMYSGLENAFPKNLQGSIGCFGSVEAAKEISERSPSHRNRHFRAAGDLIELSDATIAVCNQWGIGNIEAFIGNASRLGCDIKPE